MFQNQINSSSAISQVGKKKDDPLVQELISFLKTNDPFFEIYEPCPENIVTLNDNWATYEARSFGFTIEFLDVWVSNVSFTIAFSDFYKPTEMRKIYSGSFDSKLQGCTNRAEVHQSLGKPNNANNDMDQYYVGEDLILGLLYEEATENLLNISYGAKKIFSNPEYFPNRFSLIFNSLHDIPNDENE